MMWYRDYQLVSLRMADLQREAFAERFAAGSSGPRARTARFGRTRHAMAAIVTVVGRTTLAMADRLDACVEPRATALGWPDRRA